MLLLSPNPTGGFDAHSATGQYRGWAPTKRKAVALAHRPLVPVSRAMPVSVKDPFRGVKYGWMFDGKMIFERGPVGGAGIGNGLYIDMKDGTVFKYGPAEEIVVGRR